MCQLILPILALRSARSTSSRPDRCRTTPPPRRRRAAQKFITNLCLAHHPYPAKSCCQSLYHPANHTCHGPGAFGPPTHTTHHTSRSVKRRSTVKGRSTTYFELPPPAGAIGQSKLNVCRSDAGVEAQIGGTVVGLPAPPGVHLEGSLGATGVRHRRSGWACCWGRGNTGQRGGR